MSDIKNDKATTPAAEGKFIPPTNLPEELLPVYDWYKKNGKDTLLYVIIALIAAIACTKGCDYIKNRNVTASAALINANDVESLENINGLYARTRVAPIISLRLAKAYYEAGNYAQAEEQYNAFLSKNSRHPLAPQAKLGRASSLEAEQKFDEAKDAYAELAADKSAAIYPEAILGQARCLAALNDKAAANDLLDRLAIDKKDTRWESQAETLRGVINRFSGFKSTSIYDQLSAASSDADAPAAETAAPAAEVPDPAPATDATPAPAAEAPQAPAPEAPAVEAPAPAPAAEPATAPAAN